MRFVSSPLLAGALLAAPALAAAQGHYSAALRTMLDKAATGTCDAAMMQPSLFKACEAQMPKYGPEWKAAGPVKSMTFVKADPAGRKTETYRVTFASGKTLVWHIGGLKDGKFDSLYGDED